MNIKEKRNNTNNIQIMLHNDDKNNVKLGSKINIYFYNGF